ncbi:MAG TPA: alpha-L-rhamnosidase C-terminal domain-containing protein, partial [Prolixibacteraceae bacterium]|nr:alpha-L-rhamnosidase C-terminal domain-containing protein [Prolixibacteraceae bacterium]
SGFAKSSLQRQVEGKPEIIRDVLGDWMAPVMVFSDSLRNNTMAPPEGMTLYGTAAHYRVVESVSKINRILGNETRAIEYEKWAQRIGRNFNLEFFDQKSKTYHGDKPTNFRQSANVVPLDYGLVQKENREIVVQKVLQDIHENGDRLATGFLGTASMMAWLPQADPELAFKLSTHRNYPGWGYMVEQGANTMWEAWDGDNSRNHPPFCLISEYFFRYLAGIQPDPANPGFRHFFVNPSVVGDLTFVNATHECPYGSIKSNWKRENDLFILEVTVPVNTTATILLLAKPGSQISESGQDVDKIKGVRYLRYEQGKAVFELGSGNYLFQSKL